MAIPTDTVALSKATTNTDSKTRLLVGMRNSDARALIKMPSELLIIRQIGKVDCFSSVIIHYFQKPKGTHGYRNVMLR
jgi:hypothetical protein